MTRHPCHNPDCTHCDTLAADREVERDYPDAEDWGADYAAADEAFGRWAS